MPKEIKTSRTNKRKRSRNRLKVNMDKNNKEEKKISINEGGEAILRGWRDELRGRGGGLVL